MRGGEVVEWLNKFDARMSKKREGGQVFILVRLYLTLRFV